MERKLFGCPHCGKNIAVTLDVLAGDRERVRVEADAPVLGKKPPRKRKKKERREDKDKDDKESLFDRLSRGSQEMIEDLGRGGGEL